MSDQVIVTQTRTRCRHIHAAGHQCGSPALRKRTFCYYHDATHRPYPNPHSFRYLDHNKMSFMLPVLEDHRSILLALSQVAARVASNDLDPLRANILLHTIRAASTALARESRDLDRVAQVAETEQPATAATASETVVASQPVLDPVFDTSWGPLAPDPDAQPGPIVYLEDPADIARRVGRESASQSDPENSEAEESTHSAPAPPHLPCPIHAVASHEWVTTEAPANACHFERSEESPHFVLAT